MKPQFQTKLPRVWPLIFSGLAVWGLVHILPSLYRDFGFSRDGMRTAGWYTDLEEQNELIHYAYKVGDKVFGGQESWDEENSNIYSHHNGDKVELMYLSKRPWISTRHLDPAWYLHNSATWTLFYVSIFFAGIWLCTLRVRKPKAAIKATQSDSIPQSSGTA